MDSVINDLIGVSVILLVLGFSALMFAFAYRIWTD